MLIYTNKIPSSHYTTKTAQIVPEQTLNETVSVYAEAVPYIRCEIQSTIQHEAGHRSDEFRRYEDIQSGKNVSRFDQFSEEGRVEGIAEQEEEGCVYPKDLSGEIEQINLNAIFEEAKGQSHIDPNYKKDVRAGHLNPDAQGMYLMQDLPFELRVNQTKNPNMYRGFDGTLWIDVRKIVQPFIVDMNSQKSNPPTYQTDGITPDLPAVSRQPPTQNSVPSVPAAPEVPSIGAR